jgi:uncharacterized membrane protein YbhN (UPF0104 family)
VLAKTIANRWVRTGILALVLACCGFWVVRDWPAAASAMRRLRLWTIGGSLALAVAGVWCMMLAWRAVLEDLGSALPVPVAARVNFVAQLGKYVPGAVWAFAAQVELSHDRRVPRQRAVVSVAISLAITTGAGLTIAACTLPFASPQAVSRYWWALIAVPFGLFGLCPPVLGWAVDRLLAIIRRPPLEHGPSWSGLAKTLGWTVLGWLLLGAHAWLLLTAMTGRGLAVLPLAIGGYAFAFCTGLLLVVFPGGIGAREVVLVAVLTLAVPHGAALALAITTRAATMICDLGLGATGLALARIRPVTVQTPAPVPGSAPVPVPAPVSRLPRLPRKGSW